MLAGNEPGSRPPRNCFELYKYFGNDADGIYNITIGRGPAVQVYCDMTTDSWRGKGWTVVLLRDSLLCVAYLLLYKLEKAAQGAAQCEVSAYAPSCRRCVATYWKVQTRWAQNCKYLR